MTQQTDSLYERYNVLSQSFIEAYEESDHPRLLELGRQASSESMDAMGRAESHEAFDIAAAIFRMGLDATEHVAAQLERVLHMQRTLAAGIEAGMPPSQHTLDKVVSIRTGTAFPREDPTS